MSWLLAHFYDRMMAAPEQACLSAWRKQLLAEVSGEVLELGAGTGASLPFYGPRVTRLVLAEPDPHMRRKLEERLGSGLDGRAEAHAASAVALPFPDASFDVAVSMLVLCSVQDLEASLAELHRVLRPAGRLVFLEHVAADTNPGRLRWQRRLQPAWRLAAGNCHLARDTTAAIEAAGFTFETLQKESIRTAMPLARPSIRGVARRG